MRFLIYICFIIKFNMKQLAILFSLLSVLILSSCGGETTNDNPTENTDETVQLKGFEELNLTEYGFNLTVMVPEAETNGDPEVVMTERGALEILVGNDFGIEIMYGEGDLALLKMDLEEDLVFKSEIIKEEENALIYKQDIPDSGVKTQNHFFYKAVVGNDVYEVRDVMEGEYGEGMIEKMLEAAKTIKSANSSQTAA